MTEKRNVFVVGPVSVLLLLLSGSRTWVTGTLSDAVLANTKVSVGGSSAAPVLTAGALVGAAAVIAVLTAGRVARSIAALLAGMAGVIALVAAIGVIRDPSQAVEAMAAGSTGRTGDFDAEGMLTLWPWVGVGGAVLLIATGVLASLGGRRWSGLSSKYDAPGAGTTQTAGTAGTRKTSAWDQLTEGTDPTQDDPEEDVPGPA